MSSENLDLPPSTVIEVINGEIGDTVVSAVDNSTVVTVEDPRDDNFFSETTITVEEFYDLQVLTLDEPSYGAGSALGSGQFKFLFTLNASHLGLETSPGIISVPIVSDYEGPILGVSDVTCYVDGRKMRQNRGWKLSSDGLFLEVYVPTDETMRETYLNSEIEYELVWTF